MGFFTGDMIDPRQIPPQFPDINYGFGKWLSALMHTAPNGDVGLFGANGFNPFAGSAQMAKDHLTIKPNDRLKGAWGSWQPWDGGTQYIANYLQNGSGPNQQVQGAMNNMMEYGVSGGYPGQLMHNMAQYGGAAQQPTQWMSNMAQFGGTGGAGNRAMSNAMQFGAPSAAGQGVSNMQQFGVASEQSGRPLANRAYGQQTAATNFLAPFMQPRPQQFQNAFGMQQPQLPGLPRFGGYGR